MTIAQLNKYQIIIVNNIYKYTHIIYIEGYLHYLNATKSAEVVTECQQAFGFQPIRNQINCRKFKFLNRYVTSPYCICTIACNQCAVNEIQYLTAERPIV